MINNSIINEAKIDIKKAREWKDIAVKLTNLTIKYQSIDDANDYQRYILEDLELDIRERYPNMPIPTMRVLLNLVQKYLDGAINLNLDDIINELNKLIGFLSVTIKPHKPTEPSQTRLFNSVRVEDKPKNISHYKDISHYREQAQNQAVPRKSFYIDEKHLDQNLKIVATVANGTVEYDHDKAFYALLPYMYTPNRRKSFPKNGRWQCHYITKWMLETSDVMKVLDWRPNIAA
jgi:hypothetical protein